MRTLAHDFFLLSLHDLSGTNLCKDKIELCTHVSAAFIAELMFMDRLVAVRANHFQVVDAAPLEGLLGEVESSLRGWAPATLEKLIGRTRGFWGARNLEREIADELVNDGVLRIEKDTFFFIPWRTRHPAEDMTEELEVRERLRRHAREVAHDMPPCRDDALLSLLFSSKLILEVWSREELDELFPILDERARRAPIGTAAGHVTRVMRAAVAASAS